MSRILTGKVISFLLFLFILDWSFPPLAGQIKPIFLYLLVVYAGFEWHWSRTYPAAAAVGILRDAAGSGAFGVETCALVFSSWLLDFFLQKIDKSSWIMRCGVSFLFAFLVSALVLLCSALLLPSFEPAWSMGGAVFASALSTAAAAPLFFWAASRWFGDKIVLKQYELFR